MYLDRNCCSACDIARSHTYISHITRENENTPGGEYFRISKIDSAIRFISTTFIHYKSNMTNNSLRFSQLCLLPLCDTCIILTRVNSLKSMRLWCPDS